MWPARWPRWTATGMPMAATAGPGARSALPREPARRRPSRASVSSLQITSVTAAAAQRVAAHDPAVAAHPWVERATRYCLNAIEAIEEAPFAYVLAFSVRLDAIHASRPEAADLLSRLGSYIPADGRIRVRGGAEGEALRPLHVAPYPDRPARALS